MSGRQARICVAGSFMTDLVMRVERRPLAGETVPALDFGIFLGGKGFNQAVAARRMAADIAMIGRVGDDDFGHRFLSRLNELAINAEHVTVDREAGTGIATPVVDRDGQNSIIIAPRANMRVTVADVEAARTAIEAADVLLLQLEIPVEASEAAARIARAAGRTVVLNPAPALPVPRSLLEAATIITPNEIEAATLLGRPVSARSAGHDADELAGRFRTGVVITLGDQGLAAAVAGHHYTLPAHDVECIDSTAAGDAFNGAFVVALAETKNLAQSLHWGNAAGALAVTTLGAEPSLPVRQDIYHLVTDQLG